MDDQAEYCGNNPCYVGQKVYIRPHFETHDLPLERRKVRVRFHDHRIIHHETGREVGSWWHDFPAKDFKLLVPVRF